MRGLVLLFIEEVYVVLDFRYLFVKFLLVFIRNIVPSFVDHGLFVNVGNESTGKDESEQSHAYDENLTQHQLVIVVMIAILEIMFK
jgi:hypothetical protein